MLNRTPFFAGFRTLLPRRRVLELVARLAQIECFEEFYRLFGKLFPEHLLEPAKKGVNSRERIFSPRVTFWAFVCQVLNPASSCREIVRRIQAYRADSTGERNGQEPLPSSATSAYCQARSRLDLSTLERIASALAANLETNVLTAERWLQNRSVKIVDGTTASMPDTTANQACWPQPKAQELGCGFPQIKQVGIFSLSSGALLQSAAGNKHIHESLLFRQLWEGLCPGDVLLGDRGFCSFTTMAALLLRGVDTVMRLHQSRPSDFRRGRRLGLDDRLITWLRTQRPKAWTKEEHAALPESMPVRLIRLRVKTKGFRTSTVVLATTLLDPKLYPAQALRDLYFKRWQVELHFNQIKTMLAMDVLRCKSPEMIQRELLIHGIAYNLIRSLMQRSAHLQHVALQRISFQGTVDALRQWAPRIASAKGRKSQDCLLSEMLLIIGRDLVPLRPGRSEPRVKKRRGKNYSFLAWSRHRVRKPRRRIRHPKNPNHALS